MRVSKTVTKTRAHGCALYSTPVNPMHSDGVIIESYDFVRGNERVSPLALCMTAAGWADGDENRLSPPAQSEESTTTGETVLVVPNLLRICMLILHGVRMQLHL